MDFLITVVGPSHVGTWGLLLYPMLIVFRATKAACLKHSSLFKVKNLGRRRCPSLVGRDPAMVEKAISLFLPGWITPWLSEESVVSASILGFWVTFLPLPQRGDWRTGRWCIGLVLRIDPRGVFL